MRAEDSIIPVSSRPEKLLGMRSVQAEGKVAESLALSEGTLVTVLERQRFVDGQLIGYEISYLPRRIGEALTQGESRNQPLVPAVKRILGRAGPTRNSLRMTFSVVRREEAKVLETKVEPPVLVRRLDVPW